MARQGGLGRGLGALIPPGAAESKAGDGVRVPGPPDRTRFGQTRTSHAGSSTRSRIGAARRLDPRGRAAPAGARASGRRRLRADRGRAALARGAARSGLQHDPRARPRDRRQLARSSRRSSRTSSARSSTRSKRRRAYQQLIEDFELTHDAGRGRASARAAPSISQHAAPPPAAAVDPALGARAAALDGPRPRAARHARPRVPGGARQARDQGRPVGARGRGSRARAQRRRRQRQRATVQTGKMRPPGLLELEELLGDHLDTRVKIRLGAGGQGDDDGRLRGARGSRADLPADDRVTFHE